MPKQVLTNLDFNNVARIVGLPQAIASGQPVTLEQMQAAIEGIAWKDSVRVSTTANINLAAPGATIDGITMVANDRVIVRAQTAQPENGIYIWNGAATPMTRAPDASTSDELEGAVVVVEEGTSAGAAFRQQTVNFVLGTGNVVWTNFISGSPAATETTAGIAEIATQAETDGGSVDNVIVTPLKLANWSGRLRRTAQVIGDGTATQFTVTHNFNTRRPIVAVYRTSGAFDEVVCDVEATTVNTVTLRFAAAPASGAFEAVVLA